MRQLEGSITTSLESYQGHDFMDDQISSWVHAQMSSSHLRWNIIYLTADYL